MTGTDSHSNVPPSNKSESEEKSPADQLVDLLLYAPVGLLYEYENVLDQVVKRGRSQVQLAKVMSKMAAQRGQTEVEDNFGDVFAAAAETVAKGITEFGAAIGLAPPIGSASTPGATVDQDEPHADEPIAAETSAEAPEAERPLPVAGYDTLKAKEIIALLPDLDRDQRARIREHEAAHRGRKTVMAKLDSLDG